MYEKVNEVNAEMFLKLSIIFLMSVFVTVLALSAYIITFEQYSEHAALLHRSIGIIFLLLLPVHIYLRKDKLKNMIVEFFSILTDKEMEEQCMNHKLLRTLKKRSFAEICRVLQIDMEAALLILREKNIAVENVNAQLDVIASQNSYDALKIFTMILENHMRILQDNEITGEE